MFLRCSDGWGQQWVIDDDHRKQSPATQEDPRGAISRQQRTAHLRLKRRAGDHMAHCERFLETVSRPWRSSTHHIKMPPHAPYVLTEMLDSIIFVINCILSVWKCLECLMAVAVSENVSNFWTQSFQKISTSEVVNTTRGRCSYGLCLVNTVNMTPFEGGIITSS